MSDISLPNIVPIEGFLEALLDEGNFFTIGLGESVESNSYPIIFEKRLRGERELVWKNAKGIEYIPASNGKELFTKLKKFARITNKRDYGAFNLRTKEQSYLVSVLMKDQENVEVRILDNKRADNYEIRRDPKLKRVKD